MKDEHGQEGSHGEAGGEEQQHRNGKQPGMALRGVTRPMAVHEARSQGRQKQDGGGEEQHEMTHDERRQMLHMHYMQTLWVYWLLLILGVWMMAAPLTFGYGKAPVMPSGGRDLWLSTAARVAAMTWSDILSGLALLFFGWRSLRPNRPYSLWAACFVGIWITLAPVLFWAPAAAAYLNGTLVGALVIALTILIPGMPNMVMYMKMGPETPQGWSYNPSSWPQRSIMILLAFLGWMTSRALGAYQLGYIDAVWDPFFGESTRRVLDSDMSHMWPISDGALGATAYTFEFLMGWMGSPARWRTMPWMVAFFGILVIPLGLVHILLVISQPVVVGHWCTLCLLAAGLMLPMIPLQIDEVAAMVQALIQARRKGLPLWESFWKGVSVEGEGKDSRSPEIMDLPEHPGKVARASVWGISIPWTLAASAAIGSWLMAAPGVFALEKPVATVFHLGGSLVVVVAVISMAEVIRAGRYLNVALGLAISLLPWFLGGGTLLSQINGLACGLATAALSLPRGLITERYGYWDKYVV